MAKSNRSGKEGQAKPKAERKASAAVRGGKDDTTGGGSGKPSYYIMDSTGRLWGYASDGSVLGITSGPVDVSYDQPPSGRDTSLGPLGLEAGASDGQPVGQSTPAAGGERAAGVSDAKPDIEIGPMRAQYNVSSRNYDRGLLRAARIGTPAGANVVWAAGYAFCADEQDWKATFRADRWLIAALLIGIALGLLAAVALHMVP